MQPPQRGAPVEMSLSTIAEILQPTVLEVTRSLHSSWFQSVFYPQLAVSLPGLQLNFMGPCKGDGSEVANGLPLWVLLKTTGY